MSAPRKVLELVDRFQRNADAYHSSRYNEAQVRQEFIDPLFKCLGWDMDNEQGYAEAYKDVIHEAAIKIGGATKAPDYCFRIGGAAKFFLEAKRPSVNLKDDPDPAYQLRRYAWTGKLPLSVLTDFEEFAVYDCRVKPAHTDKAGVARIRYLRYEEYAERWDEIAGVFAREAILKGSFDKFAESNKAKRGTAAVDTAFLQEIESWRETLARNLALRNPKLSSRELNYAVQATIDRVIFLRMCEDRGIEPYGQLQKLTREPDIYPNLLDLYRKADDRYNSGLFHFHAEKGRAEAPDTLTPALTVDDKPLKDILHGLYYPECPYEFSVLSGEILGQVYEQFLGKVIRLTAGHQAKVDDKPEVRKAGGVYYTPTYIVDYIVKQTVGKLLGEPAASAAGLTPKQASRLRIVDPACGSGSFLLGAYQLLLDWHRDYYVQDGPKKHTKELYQAAGGVWRLTTAEKKRILLANVYGVDIDPQAVEVTKLSLLLKVLEGESEQTLQAQLRIFHERALPDLSSNIQCGNSLIGPDFYEGQQLNMFDEEERYRINVFDWEAAFPWLREAGGFDAVIGNPPYGRDILSDFKSYFDPRYESSQYKVDSFVLFIEKGVKLLRNGARFGYIVPNTWVNTEKFENLRRFLLSNCTIELIVNLGKDVFSAANIDTLLLFVGKNDRERIAVIDASDYTLKDRRLLSPKRSFFCLQAEWAQDSAHRFAIHSDPIEAKIFSKMHAGSVPMDEITECSQGLIPYNTRELSQKNPYLSMRKEGPEWKPLLDKGACIARYSVAWNGIFVKYGPWLYTANQPRFYENEKILIQRHRNPALARRIVASFDTDFFYYKDNLCGIISKSDLYNLRFLLGVLNSTLMNEFYRKSFTEVSLNPTYLRRLPIPRVEFRDANEKGRHDQMVRLVEQMLSLHQHLAAAKTPQEQTMLQRQIDATDRQIDQLVYNLYGLTEEEIRIVEENA